MNIYCINNNFPISKEKLSSFEEFIDSSKLARIKKYRNSKDYENALVADLLIRFAIYEASKVKYKNKPFLLNDYGKPYLPANIAVHFNVSHSGDWVVCAVDEKSIGIDVELMQEVDFLGIAKSFFTPEEYVLIANADNGRKRELFYDIWTLKESFIKAIGKGMSIDLNSFCIFKSDDSIRCTTQIPHEQCYFKQYNIDWNYKLSVCSFENDFPEDVTYLDINELYKFTLL